MNYLVISNDECNPATESDIECREVLEASGDDHALSLAQAYLLEIFEPMPHGYNYCHPLGGYNPGVVVYHVYPLLAATDVSAPLDTLGECIGTVFALN